MKTTPEPTGSDELLLMRWMSQYGDDILKTCYLLCGDLIEARIIARQVFYHAFNQMNTYLTRETVTAHDFLLSIAMRLCPCRLLPGRMIERSNAVSRFLSIPPAQRRVAVLCLYHGKSLSAASHILRIPEAKTLRLLTSAKRFLEP